MSAVGHPEVRLTTSFYESVEGLEAVDAKRCWQALHQFVETPGLPGLQFKKMVDTSDTRLWKIRAAQHLRIILAKEGNLHFPVLAGQRDQIYERAQHAKFVIDLVGETIRFVEPPDPPGRRTRRAAPLPAGPTVQVGPVLSHWTDAELAEAGFGEDEITTLRTLASIDALLGLFDEGWDEETLDLALELGEMTPDQWREQDLFGSAGEQRLRHALANFGQLHDISRLFTPEEIARIAANPIEDWMIFLHPDQRSVTTRSFDGPARVRGSAGTGKTVVGLHWAAERARRARDDGDDLPILFTTFVKTLPPVFENLYQRMPDAVPGAVEFTGVDSLAFRVCSTAGERRSVHIEAVTEAAKAAFGTVVRPGTPLARDDISLTYLRDEVDKVIKGRGLTTVDEYLAITRTGRGTRFDETRRRQAWEFREAWDAEMAARGTHNFPDTMLRALEIAQSHPEPTYRAAVIDESQDVTLVGLQLVRALVNGPSGEDRPDGLLIVGDSAQRIYPGAYTLRQAGIEVRGRTTVLRHNYRNTAGILGAAVAVAGHAQVVDIDGDADDRQQRRDDEAGESSRRGPRPLLVDCGDADSENEFLVAHISRLVASGVVGPGDIGVFVPHNAQAGSIVRKLQEGGLEAKRLRSYDGVTTPEVKVGTYARAKGLEFKVVLLPRVKEGTVPKKQGANQPDDEYAEQRDLSLSQFYVAMTRARDQLIVSFGEQPSEILVGAMDEFDTVTPEDLE